MKSSTYRGSVTTAQKKEISILTQKKLQKLLTTTGKKEQQLEFSRQNLCKIEAFEPYASFQRIDRLCRGFILPKDILTFLRDNAIDSCEEIDAKLLIHYFDSTSEGKLLYSDYLQMLLPCDQPYLRATASQRPTYPITSKDFLPFDVERALAKLIQKELNLARKQEVIKQEIAARYDCDTETLFREIDDWNYKYIDHKNLKRFLSKMGTPASESHLIAIIRRFDLDADAKLTLSEFTSGISPQLDYSKRQVKERHSRPSVNNRDLALSPGRVPETMAINKEDTINVHHSPLRSRPSGRDHSARRVVYKATTSPYDQQTKDQSCSKQKTLITKRKQTKSKSKSKTRNVKTAGGPPPLQSLKKEFASFRKALQNKMSGRVEEKKEQVLSSSRRQYTDQCIPSPYRSNQTAKSYGKDLSPLRHNTHSTPVKFSTATASAAYHGKNDYLSPKSPLSQKKTTIKSESSPINQGRQLSQVRGMRSPYKSEMAKAEEGDASLIFLTRDAFKEILAIEGSIESTKKELAMRSDFTLAGVFSRFSDNTHGRINANEMLFGLEQMGVICDISDARMLIDRYDADKDGKLGFWEFSNAILPIQPNLRDDVERKRAIWEMSSETLELFKKTFRQLVDAECMIESIRQRIHREKTVHLRQAFDSLDWLGRGFITDNEFKRAFENISLRLGSPQLHQEIVVRIEDSIEMEGMIRRFNKDKLNGRISLTEFLDELSPKCHEKTY